MYFIFSYNEECIVMCSCYLHTFAVQIKRYSMLREAIIMINVANTLSHSLIACPLTTAYLIPTTFLSLSTAVGFAVTLG